MAAASAVDPSKTATYPVVLSDALLGKASKETYTGIRCKLSLYVTAKRLSLSSQLTPFCWCR